MFDVSAAPHRRRRPAAPKGPSWHGVHGTALRLRRSRVRRRGGEVGTVGAESGLQRSRVRTRLRRTAYQRYTVMRRSQINNNISLIFYQEPSMITRISERDIDYKNVDLLRTCISEQGKILSRKVTNFDAKTQRNITRSIKRARILGLIHFTYKK